MSKTIYDEALEELTSLLHDEFDDNPKRSRLNVSQRLNMFKKVKDALEQARKQEKLFELYNRLFNVCKEHKCASIGLSYDSEFLNVMFELEEELKWVKN